VSALLADPAADPAAVVTGPITGSVTGRAVANSEYIQQFGAWEVLKSIDAFVNDLSIARKWTGGKVTVGYYSASSSNDEVWSLGNTKYQVVQRGGEVVTGIACNDPAIDSCNFNFDLDATGDATTRAFYAAATFDATDVLTFDVGVRAEKHNLQYSADTNRDGLVDFTVDFDKSKVSWTGAANYRFTDNIGAFARINRGYRMPYFDDFRDNSVAFLNGNDLIQKVEQYELGFKYATRNIGFYATGYYTKVDPSIFVALSGQTPGEISTNEAKGIEIDGTYTMTNGFAVTLNGTWQNAEIKKGVNAGKEAQRQPKWQLRVSPSYLWTVGGTDLTVYGALSAVGDRFADNANTVVLDGYEKVDVGAIARINGAFKLQLAVDNLTDKQALTEGDPRNPASPNGRFILPRSVVISVGYDF
ncbi:MAG: TonB-dependent receptor domain-containing protein, partial [Steroidobacteraceae bacterium]